MHMWGLSQRLRSPICRVPLRQIAEEIIFFMGNLFSMFVRMRTHLW